MSELEDSVLEALKKILLENPNLLSNNSNKTIPGGLFTGKIGNSKFGKWSNKVGLTSAMKNFNKASGIVNTGIDIASSYLKQGKGTYDPTAGTRVAEDVINKAAGLASAIPVFGGMLSAGMKLIGTGIGGITDKVNKDKVKSVGNSLSQLNNMISNANTAQGINLDLNKLKKLDVGLLKDFGDIGFMSSGKEVKKAYNDALAASSVSYNTAFNNILNKGNNININNTMNELSNFAAFGGNLGTNSSNWSTGLTHIDTGSTHEKNPYEGVPMGADREGTPNLVELGETIFDDYVFSDRLLVPEFKGRRIAYGKRNMKAEGGRVDSSKKNKILTWEEKLLKKYGGLSCSAAAKKIEHDMGVDERPNDWIARLGMNAYLLALMNVQELERAKKELRRGGDLKGARELNKLSGYEYAQMKAEEEARQEQEAMAQQLAAQQQLQQMMAQQLGMNPQLQQMMAQLQMDPNQLAMMLQLMMAQLGMPMQAACGGRLNKHDDGGYVDEDPVLAFMNQLGQVEDELIQAIYQLYAQLALTDPEQAYALASNIYNQYISALELQYAEGGDMQEEQTLDSELQQQGEDLEEKDPSEMTNKELNEAIEDIIDWALDTEDKQLLARAEKAKRASREEKEAFVEDAFKLILEEEAALNQRELEELAALLLMSPEEQAMMLQQAAALQSQNPEAQQLMSPEELAMMQLQMMAAQGGQPIMANGGNLFAGGGPKGAPWYSMLPGAWRDVNGGYHAPWESRSSYGGGKNSGGGVTRDIYGRDARYDLEKVDTLAAPVNNFELAFAVARKAGVPTFEFNGKVYNTKLGNNPDNSKAGLSRLSEAAVPVTHKKISKNHTANEARTMQKAGWKVTNVHAYGGNLYDSGGELEQQLQIASMYYSYVLRNPNKFKELLNGMSAFMKQYASQFLNLPLDKQEEAALLLQLKYLYDAASKDNEFLAYILLAQLAQQLQYAEGGELSQEEIIQLELQSQEEQQNSIPEFLSIEDPAELSTKDLNKAIDEVLQYAKENKIRDLVKAARKAKKGSRDDKEDFIEDAIDEVTEIEELKAQEQQAELSQEVSPEELMMMQQLLQLPSEEEMQLLAMQEQMMLLQMMQLQGAAPADAGNELDASMQAEQQFAYGGKVNKYGDGSSKYIPLDTVLKKLRERENNYALAFNTTRLPFRWRKKYPGRTKLEALELKVIEDMKENNSWYDIPERIAFPFTVNKYNYKGVFNTEDSDFINEYLNILNKIDEATINGKLDKAHIRSILPENYKRNLEDPRDGSMYSKEEIDKLLNDIVTLKAYNKSDQKINLAKLRELDDFELEGLINGSIPDDIESFYNEEGVFDRNHAIKVLQGLGRFNPEGLSYRALHPDVSELPISYWVGNPDTRHLYLRDHIGDELVPLEFTSGKEVFGGDTTVTRSNGDRYKKVSWISEDGKVHIKDHNGTDHTYDSIKALELSDDYLYDRYMLAKSAASNNTNIFDKRIGSKNESFSNRYTPELLFGKDYKNHLDTFEEFKNYVRTNYNTLKKTSLFFDGNEGLMHGLTYRELPLVYIENNEIDKELPFTDFYNLSDFNDWDNARNYNLDIINYNKSPLAGLNSTLFAGITPTIYKATLKNNNPDIFVDDYEPKNWLIYDPFTLDYITAELDYKLNENNYPFEDNLDWEESTDNIDEEEINNEEEEEEDEEEEEESGITNPRNPSTKNNVTHMYFDPDKKEYVRLNPERALDSEGKKISPITYLISLGYLPGETYKDENGNEVRTYKKLPEAPLPNNIPFYALMGLGLGALGWNIYNATRPDEKKYKTANKLIEASRKAGTYNPVTFTPIGDFVNPSRFNMNYWADLQKAAMLATQNAIMNANNGNIGSTNLALLANAYNANMANGDLARKGQEYNTDLAFKEAEFNKDTNKFNKEGILKANIANQEALSRAYNAELTGLGNAYAMMNDIDKENEAAINASIKNVMDGFYNRYLNNNTNKEVVYLADVGALDGAKVQNLPKAHGGFLKPRIGLQHLIGG